MTSKSLTEILRSQSSPPSRTDGRLTKAYSGRRDRSGGTIVRIVEHGDAHALPLRLDLENRSPTGFEWGYGGSGPAQLALAILADALDNDRLARQLYQKFKWRVIAPLPRDRPWQISQRRVLEVVCELIKENITGGI